MIVHKIIRVFCYILSGLFFLITFLDRLLTGNYYITGIIATLGFLWLAFHFDSKIDD